MPNETEMKTEAVTQETQEDFVNAVLVEQKGQQVLIKRLDKDGNVVSDDPITDREMLDFLKSATNLVDERIQQIRMVNAAYEGHMAAIRELQRMREDQEKAQAQAASQVEMPE